MFHFFHILTRNSLLETDLLTLFLINFLFTTVLIISTIISKILTMWLLKPYQFQHHPLLFWTQALKTTLLFQYPMFTHTISPLSRLFIELSMSPLLRLSCFPSDVGSIKLLILQMLNISSLSLTPSMPLKESLILHLIYIKPTL